MSTARFWMSSGLVLLLLVIGISFSAQASGSEGRYFVEFDRFGPGSSRAVREAGGRPVHEFARYRLVAAWLSTKARERLAQNPNVRSIEEDPKRHPYALSDAQTVPYGIPMVQADLVSSADGGSRKICVIDSGYYTGHVDLSNGANVTGNSDPGGAGDWFVDRCGHGTHVAGTIAALSNTYGVVGAVPPVGLHVVKVFGDDCSWTYSSSLMNGLDKCAAAGSNVVSMSLGGTLKSRWEERAFGDAYKSGVLSVAAAGNAGNGTKSYPASYDSVISVAAIDGGKVVASFSQQNDQVELSAPGVDVLSTVPWPSENTLAVGADLYLGNKLEGAVDGSATGLLAGGSRCTGSDPSWAGKIVLCERGDVSFYDKLVNVQAGGGVGAVVYNNQPGNFLGTLGDQAVSPSIPAISLSQEDGQALVSSRLDETGSLMSELNQGVAGSGYEAWSGTSMATPHVSGVAALVWSHNPSWTNRQIRDSLGATAEDLGAAGRDLAYGYGLVRAKAALEYLLASSPICSAEICSDGLDNDCDGLIDGADPDCAVCSLGQAGDFCTTGAGCCSGKCAGKPGAKTCK